MILSEGTGKARDQDEGEISPFIYHMLALAQHPIGILRRRWAWMTLALVVGLLATGALYSTQVPTYEASATVMCRGSRSLRNLCGLRFRV